MDGNKLIVICGPTASGKTGLAIEMAQKFNGEIVCADSRTIYQEMNIGTAKPSIEERLKIPHYLLDLIPIDEEFTVAEFKTKALNVIQEIKRHYKTPFLVGGTGLYISSIVNNLDIPPVPPDKRLRKKLEKKIVKYGLDYLWQKLIKIDPDAAIFVQRQNPRRIIRALEVCLKTKKPFSKLRKMGQSLFDCLQIGIKVSKSELIKRISQRTDQMIKNGLVEEVRELIQKYRSNLPALNTIGYQEIISYLRNEVDLETAVKLIKKNTLQYARRQMTWFKKDKSIQWIDNNQEVEKLIKEFLL